jgi:cytoskeleton protein RodZ
MINSIIDNEFELAELDEDMEVVGPGQMLSQARLALWLTPENIAEQLKLRLCLIANIENDIFEANISETYIRGYLRSYAKIVRVSEEDIIASYKMLSVAKKQCAEMKSFSKITKKQAANSLLMWVTYLIIFILIGSTVMWWLQNIEEKSMPISEKIGTQIENLESHDAVEVTAVVDGKNDIIKGNHQIASEVTEDLTVTNGTDESVNSNLPTVQPFLSNAVFTFSGDSWVKVFDATGARKAIGIKKAGYVMSISGVAPLKVTVGKPERVQIIFNDQTIKMEQFDLGNIAKFTLPLNLNPE